MLCIWSIYGNCVVHSCHPSAMNGLVAMFNNFFFFPSVCPWVTFAKFVFLIETRERHLKQYLFYMSTQHVPLVHRRQRHPTLWTHLQSYKVAGYGCHILKWCSKILYVMLWPLFGEHIIPWRRQCYISLVRRLKTTTSKILHLFM